MALSKVQRGELTNRLRNFFGLTGSYSADLDTTVAAVAQVQNLDDPPFRQIGFRWFYSRINQPVAGSYTRTLFTPEDNAIAVIDSLLIHNSDVAAHFFYFELEASTGGVATTGIVPEGAKSDGATITGGVNGPVIAEASDVAGPIPPLGNFPIFKLLLAAGETLYLPTQLVLLNGIALIGKEDTTGVPFTLNVSGRWWPTAGA